MIQGSVSLVLLYPDERFKWHLFQFWSGLYFFHCFGFYDLFKGLTYGCRLCSFLIPQYTCNRPDLKRYIVHIEYSYSLSLLTLSIVRASITSNFCLQTFLSHNSIILKIECGFEMYGIMMVCRRFWMVSAVIGKLKLTNWKNCL